MDPQDTSARKSAIASLVCGAWFLLTGWMWTFLACLVISYPVALLGVWFWRLGKRKDPDSKLNRAALGLLFLGLAVSVGAIFLFK